MKKISTLLFISIFTLQINAQTTMNDLFSSKNIPVVFLGLDFAQAHFIGAEGFNDPAKIESYYLQRWNDLIMEEEDKYTLQKALKLGKDYSTNTDDMIKHNTTFSIKGRIQETPYTIDAEKVKAGAQKYELSQKEGIGVVYVVETLNKLRTQATIWVTFIDMSNNNVLHTEKFTSSAGGFGFRNYWLRTVYETNKQVAKKYKTWSKQYK